MEVNRFMNLNYVDERKKQELNNLIGKYSIHEEEVTILLRESMETYISNEKEIKKNLKEEGILFELTFLGYVLLHINEIATDYRDKKYSLVKSYHLGIKSGIYELKLGYQDQTRKRLCKQLRNINKYRYYLEHEECLKERGITFLNIDCDQLKLYHLKYLNKYRKVGKTKKRLIYK